MLRFIFVISGYLIPSNLSLLIHIPSSIWFPFLPACTLWWLLLVGHWGTHWHWQSFYLGSYFPRVDVGPFVFGLNIVQEGLQSQFWLNMSCASYRKSWKMEQVKKNKLVAERNNATPAREKQLQKNKKSCEPKDRRSHLA